MDIITATSTKNQYNLIQDDILHWAASYTGPKFHSLLCDPPYHLTITKRFGKPGSAPAKYGKDGAFSRASKGFMSQSWDGGGIAFNPETWAAQGEHLYDGAFGMAFASSRGWHRLAVAIEDAGFIIHPSIFGWCFLSGFPKATRIKNEVFESHRYGLQAMKPALEPIILFQKPYAGRSVDCIVTTGAGALNIDNGRISTNDSLDGGGYMTPVSEGWDRPWRHNEDIKEAKEQLKDKRDAIAESLGRWPANLILDESGAALLDRQSGESFSSGGYKGKSNGSLEGWGYKADPDKTPLGYGDSGGASRMFFQSDWRYEILEQLENADPLHYEPKVSTAERNAGLDDPNPHPTLKPISLTKYLSSLLLPPDAYAPRRILVPFAGVGSEMIGAILAGWDEVTGIEKTPAYIPVAEKRLKWWSQWPGWDQTDVDKILASVEPKEEQPQAVQIGMF